MKKLLTDWKTVPLSPLNQRGNPPRPLLCLPRRRLPRAREPASGRPGAARGEQGAEDSASGREWRTKWAANPRSRRGLSIFRAEEATIS